jgi:Reverse transcriptase (RNA-dependent DNA polymerase)
LALLPTLTNFVNECLFTGKFPSIWKKATVTPILKANGNSTDPLSYRPISVLPFMSKILESIISDKILSFLKLNNMLNDSQYGFRRNRSCIDATIQLTNDLFYALDKNQIAGILFFDFTKAFDYLSFSKLFHKLQNRFNLPLYLIRILANYLSYRQFKIKIGLHLSEFFNIFGGVPQGSVLGPLLFLLYIDDLSDKLKSKKCLFADDLATVNIDSQYDLVRSQMATTVNYVLEWSSANNMRINWKKTKCMFLMNRNMSKKVGDLLPLIVNDNEIEAVKLFKYLGIIIDSNLTFNDHVIYICKKMMMRCNMLLRFKRSISEIVMPLLFNSLVLSLPLYGIEVWGCSNLLSIHKLINNFLRSIHPRSKGNIDNLYEKFNILKINEMYQLNVILTTNRILFSNSVSAYLNSLFDLSKRITTSKKNFDVRLIVPRLHYKISRNSFKYIATKVWNSFPLYIKCIKPVDEFKHECCKFFVKCRERC